MPAETQNLKKYLDESENLYEAIMVIANRARQINEEQFQRKRDRQILYELDGEIEEELLHADEEKLEAETPAEAEENPIVTAQREFLEKKFSYYYESTRRQ
jgi:DNA-directed RNA polymerase subunit K/omega